MLAATVSVGPRSWLGLLQMQSIATAWGYFGMHYHGIPFPRPRLVQGLLAAVSSVCDQGHRRLIQAGAILHVAPPLYVHKCLYNPCVAGGQGRYAGVRFVDGNQWSGHGDVA
jgi:hypothetical protein